MKNKIFFLFGIIFLFSLTFVSAAIHSYPYPQDHNHHTAPFVYVSTYNESIAEGTSCNVWHIKDGTLCFNNSVTARNGRTYSSGFTIMCGWGVVGEGKTETTCTGDGSVETQDGLYYIDSDSGVSTITKQIGLNYYKDFDYYLNFTGDAIRYSYDEAFMMDDFGTCANNLIMYKYDKTNWKVGFPEYSGKLRIWNWTGMKTGQREAIDGTDRGTFHITGFSDPWASGKNINDSEDFCVDNDNNGFCELVGSDYNGFMFVTEYNTTGVIEVWREPSDRGTYRQSPTWCDIDEDGDYDVFGCEYSGLCRLYTWDGSTYQLNVTTIDIGTNYYGGTPACGDIRNNGRTYIMTADYNGVPRLWNWTGSTLSNIWTGTDRGNIYSNPFIGKFLVSNTDNYVMIPFTNGIIYAYNCSLGGATACSEMDSSADIGSTSYGGATGVIRWTGNYQSLYFMNTDGSLIYAFLSTPTTISTVTLDDIYGQSYTRVGIPKTNEVGYPEFFIMNNRYAADIQVNQLTAALSSTTATSHNKGSVERHYTKQYFYGFLYGDGWSCGDIAETDFDGDGDNDDVCIISTYDGLPIVYTLQPIREYSIGKDTPGARDYVIIPPELAIVDTNFNGMLYRPEGENRTYLVDTERNLFDNCYSYAWCTFKDDEGTSILAAAMVDGVITGTPKDTDANDINWDNSASITDVQYIEINISKNITLGGLGLWNEFTSEYDPYDYRIEISSESCDDTPTFTVVFDEDESNSNTDITGSGTSKGWKIFFKPQEVRCIRISSAGVYYSQSYWGGVNSLVEIQGYRGRDSFLFAPIDENAAEVDESYGNLQIYSKPFSPYDDYNLEYGSALNPAGAYLKSFTLEVVKWVVRIISQY